MTTQTLETVLRTFQHYKLLSANQTLIVGVSGGTDSLALLHILLQLQDQLNIRLHVATLNHGIRDDSAEADAMFVQQMATLWRVPYTRGDADVPQLATDDKIGIEEAARRARYEFLARVAHEQGANYVAVAHHADDQAETILMHIIRGSGLNGLRGMQVSSAMPHNEELTLLRPLLGVTRAELEQYCRDNMLNPRHDETNDDTDYQRNYIRHEIVPRLATINPNVVDALLRLSENATDDLQYLSAQYEQLILPNVKKTKQRWQIDLSFFRNQSLAMQRRFVRQAFQRLSQSTEQIGAGHVSDVLDSMGLQVGTIVDLGQGMRSRVGYDVLYIEQADAPITYENYTLIPDGTTIQLSQLSPQLNTYFVNIEQKYRLRIGLFDRSLHVKTDVSSIKIGNNSEIRLRTRQNGDRFKPKGMNGHSRKLKDWMIDQKIPREIRNRIPLITVNGDIVAIYAKNRWHLAHNAQDYVNEMSSVYLILDTLKT